MLSHFLPTTSSVSSCTISPNAVSTKGGVQTIAAPALGTRNRKLDSTFYCLGAQTTSKLCAGVWAAGRQASRDPGSPRAPPLRPCKDSQLKFIRRTAPALPTGPGPRRGARLPALSNRPAPRRPLASTAPAPPGEQPGSAASAGRKPLCPGFGCDSFLHSS